MKAVGAVTASPPGPLPLAEMSDVPLHTPLTGAVPHTVIVEVKLTVVNVPVAAERTWPCFAMRKEILFPVAGVNGRTMFVFAPPASGIASCFVSSASVRVRSDDVVVEMPFVRFMWRIASTRVTPGCAARRSRPARVG